MPIIFVGGEMDGGEGTDGVVVVVVAVDVVAFDVVVAVDVEEDGVGVGGIRLFSVGTLLVGIQPRFTKIMVLKEYIITRVRVNKRYSP